MTQTRDKTLPLQMSTAMRKVASCALLPPNLLHQGLQAVTQEFGQLGEVQAVLESINQLCARDGDDAFLVRPFNRGMEASLMNFFDKSSKPGRLPFWQFTG